MAEHTPTTDPPAESDIPSTSGMTTKVVKGSFWTLAGQVLPLAAALVSTPFVIRLLGSEAYGVLILVGLIPTYFSFADLGMSMASTKYGSEAYGRGLRGKEGEIVRTAALIGLLGSLCVAIPIFVFSDRIITDWFQVPENNRTVAGIALKITSVSFVFGIMASIFNTPMLARLRMDLNMVVNAVPKVLMSLITPVVLYLGGHIVEAVWVAFFASALVLVGMIFFSGRLLPELYRLTIDREVVPTLLKFGGGWMMAMIAGILLVNLEKLVLASYVSVKALAYYSVAFTFASMAAMFASAMTQALIPAFSQLLTPDRRSQLFSRTIKLNLIWVFPAIMIMFVASEPFFTLWAGPEFGRESTFPFYILLVGLFFNILAYIPQSLLISSGRTDVLAKLYWSELFLYVIGAYILINYYGIAGAATAWSLRVLLDAILIFWLARRMVGIPLYIFHRTYALLATGLILLPPVVLVLVRGHFFVWLIPVTAVSATFYLLLVWNRFVDEKEKEWVKDRTRDLLVYFEKDG